MIAILTVLEMFRFKMEHFHLNPQFTELSYFHKKVLTEVSLVFLDTVNSEIFTSAYAKFVKIKPSQNSKITLSIADIC